MKITKKQLKQLIKEEYEQAALDKAREMGAERELERYRKGTSDIEISDMYDRLVAVQDEIKKLNANPGVTNRGIQKSRARLYQLDREQRSLMAQLQQGDEASRHGWSFPPIAHVKIVDPLKPKNEGLKITKSVIKNLIKEELTALDEMVGADVRDAIQTAIDDYQINHTDHGSAEPFSGRVADQIDALAAAVEAVMADPGPPVR